MCIRDSYKDVFKQMLLLRQHGCSYAPKSDNLELAQLGAALAASAAAQGAGRTQSSAFGYGGCSAVMRQQGVGTPDAFSSAKDSCAGLINSSVVMEQYLECLCAKRMGSSSV